MRKKLGDRRRSITEKVAVSLDGGKVIKVLVTFGFDNEGLLKEVFCADFKAGTSIHTMVMDACVLMSKLFQYGIAPLDVARSLADNPPSIMGTIAQAAAKLDGERVYDQG